MAKGDGALAWVLRPYDVRLHGAVELHVLVSRWEGLLTVTFSKCSINVMMFAANFLRSGLFQLFFSSSRMSMFSNSLCSINVICANGPIRPGEKQP